MRWKVNPYRALGTLGCVRTSNPTYISEFGWEGLVADKGAGLLLTLWGVWRLESEQNFGMGSALWDGAPTLGRDSYLAEEGLYG